MGDAAFFGLVLFKEKEGRGSLNCRDSLPEKFYFSAPFT
jgi:hypothetical protein